MSRLGVRAKAAVPELRAILKSSADPDVLQVALEALAAIGRDGGPSQREVLPFLPLDGIAPPRKRRRPST